jgi:anaerobic selenocysteine-containing dehydrogenase
MGVSRRDFLKLSGGTVLVATLGVNLDPAKAYAKDLRIKNAKQTTTVCPYCSVGCGIVVYVENGKIINTEGDPDHPISEGALCAKGSSVSQLVNNDTRVKKPMYRARRNGLERGRMGLGAGQDRPAGQRTPGTRASKRYQKLKSKKNRPTAAC